MFSKLNIFRTCLILLEQAGAEGAGEAEAGGLQAARRALDAHAPPAPPGGAVSGGAGESGASWQPGCPLVDISLAGWCQTSPTHHGPPGGLPLHTGFIRNMLHKDNFKQL